METPKNILLHTMSLCLILLAVFVATGVAWAEKERVHIVASKSGSYDVENQIFAAEGDVEIKFGELVLRGDQLQVNFSTGELWLEGAVSLTQSEQEIMGQSLSYNLETGEGTFDQARSEIALAEGTGTIFLFGESVGIVDQNYKISNAQFTTCDLSESHFHVATKELEVILGEKVIIRGVTYYEGKIPLFYWPYLVIPLDSTDEERFFTLPVLGYGDHEGYYMKNTFNYYLNSKAYGNIYLDLFTRLGVGVGLRHNYDLASWGKGSLYLYGLPSSTSPVSKSAWNHQVTWGSLVFKTNTTQEDSWVRQELNSQNRLTVTLPKLTAEAWFNYKTNPLLQVKKLKEYGGRWSQKLTDQWRLNLHGTWTERESIQTLRLLDYLAETNYRQGKHSLTLAIQQQYNPDLLTNTTNQPWRSVQRIPELKWEVSDLGLVKLPLKSQVVLGRYEEQPSLVKQTRALAQLGLKPGVWRPLDKLSFNYQGDLNTALYGDGQQQTWTYGRLTLNQKLIEGLNFTSTYSRRDVWGTTPFRFDRQVPLEDLSMRLSYTDSKWYASINSNYNFKQKSFGTLVLQTRWRQSQTLNLDLYATYDLNAHQVLRLVPMVEYQKGDVDLRLAARYLPATKVLERVDARLSVPFGDTWQVGYDSVFEPPRQAFTQGRVTVTKDLHCRELSASYDHVAKRVALQYTINAFPTLPIGWDSQGGLSLFDLEEVADIIGVTE